MDKLKELLASKKKTAAEEFQGKKYVKRSEIEDLRLKRLREEEQEELRLKAAKKRQLDHSDTENASDGGVEAASKSLHKDKGGAAALAAVSKEVLSKEEVIRRLRALGEPASLFGESDEARHERLVLAEQNLQVEDEAAGGQQANLHIEFQREEKAKRKRGRGEDATIAAIETNKGDKDEEDIDPEQQKLMQAFQQAADSLAEQQMTIEERIAKWLKKWLKDWEDDLASRPLDVQQSAEGYQADVRFKETKEYFKPLFSRLKNKSLDPQMLAGLKMIIEAMKGRNYLYAYKLYMGLAIGNSPWPIGVTHVGLHERSAREKISFKHATGAAHIMNDEATRKFIQALKRLMTFCQRRYPTDPSRSVDFDGLSSQGRGAIGSGSDKMALLEAAARGDDLTPMPAVAMFDAKGGVKPPEKWNAIIRDAMAEVDAEDAE